MILFSNLLPGYRDDENSDEALDRSALEGLEQLLFDDIFVPEGWVNNFENEDENFPKGW